MKNVYLITMVSIVALLLGACSGGGGGDGTGEEKIVITNCETYITTQTNDLLVKDDNTTIIKVIHDVNGTKRVCVVSGNAYIIRGELR